jgi:hypothetical protein
VGAMIESCPASTNERIAVAMADRLSTPQTAGSPGKREGHTAR